MKQIRTIAELREIIPPAHPLTSTKILDHLDEQAAAFLATSPFLLLSTAGEEGRIDVSPRGDDPGFVRIEDPRTIVLPERAGNNLAFTLENIVRNPNVGLIALRPNAGETLRINGKAAVLVDPDLLDSLAARGKPAMVALRISIERAYFQCARAVLRGRLWNPESWPQPLKISFGKIIGKRASLDEKARENLDKMVEGSYKSL